MLRDASWAKLANKDETLCAGCMFDRARGVELTLADLNPCPFNTWHRPLSWFDLFARDETPAAIELWLKEIEDAEAAARSLDR
jgi:hypothetical protein